MTLLPLAEHYGYQILYHNQIGFLLHFDHEKIYRQCKYGFVSTHFVDIHVQLFPGDLLEPNYADPDNPERLMARTEVERRLPYFDQLEGKTLIQLIKTCLHNSPSRRPTAEQLLGTLMEVRVIIEGDYGELATVDAVRQVRTIKALKSRSEDKANELAAKDEEIQQLQQELEVCCYNLLLLYNQFICYRLHMNSTRQN